MSSTENLSQLNAADFVKNIGGKETALFILRNNKGSEVAITNYGGAICSIMVPDKNGVYTIDAVNEDLYIYVANLETASLAGIKDFILNIFSFFRDLMKWFFGV